MSNCGCNNNHTIWSNPPTRATSCHVDWNAIACAIVRDLQLISGQLQQANMAFCSTYPLFVRNQAIEAIILDGALQVQVITPTVDRVAGAFSLEYVELVAAPLTLAANSYRKVQIFTDTNNVGPVTINGQSLFALKGTIEIEMPDHVDSPELVIAVTDDADTAVVNYTNWPV